MTAATRIRQPRGYTERQWQGQVEDLLQRFNWLYYHTWRSDHSAAGFPDITAVRDERLVFLELKTDDDKHSQPSDAQLEWLAALSRTGAHSGVYRPRDIAAVVELLR